MPLEDRIRSVGTKGVTYPWLRRYVVIGPYNRRVRHDVVETVFARAFASALDRVISRGRTPPKKNRG